MTKAVDAKVEAVAREIFMMSWGGHMGLWHWPGDEPRPLSPRCFSDRGQMTLPVDDPSAPKNGEAAEELRMIARRLLAAAEAA
jgi:hypothetical protein